MVGILLGVHHQDVFTFLCFPLASNIQDSDPIFPQVEFQGD